MLVLDSSHSDTALARRAAVRFVRTRCPWADVHDVVLVVSELLGNAVRHTDDGGWRLRMACRRPEELLVEVSDSSSVRPVPRPGDPDNGGGFGWGIARQLTSSLTVVPHGAGKSVRAVWHRETPADGGPADAGAVIDGPVIDGAVIDGAVIGSPATGSPAIGSPVVGAPVLAGPALSGPVPG
ncbi:ATP-binding protein [Streptomyces sp. NPDC058525]|uniref:ATP-binding protein n=1 Tax=Streptomyces sp. NPDC058525 TaxID=3346538 RepID=UPI0036642BE7